MSLLVSHVDYQVPQAHTHTQWPHMQYLNINFTLSFLKQFLEGYLSLFIFFLYVQHVLQAMQ